MTEISDDAPAPQTIQERIAALKLGQVGHGPGTPPPVIAKKKPPPPLPKRTQSSVDGVTHNGEIGNTPAARGRAPQPPTETHTTKAVLPAPVMKKWEGRETTVTSPPLPARRGSDKPSPALPARRPSENGLSRKQSVESISSIASGRSSISTMSLRGPERSKSRVRAPEYDPATLPPLPEKKFAVEEEAIPRLPMRSTVSSPNVSRTNGNGPPPLPGRPALPARRKDDSSSGGPVQPPSTPGRPRRNILEMGFNNKDTVPPPVPASRPSGSFGGSSFGGASSLSGAYGQLKNTVNKYTNGHGKEEPTPDHASSIQNYDGASASPPGDSAVVQLTTNNFDEVVLHSGRPVFVDFYASFCKCKYTFMVADMSVL